LSHPLDAVVDEIARAPHSAAALTLYALVSTLEQERAGCLFKLDKLRDLDPGQRELACGLVELMVARRNTGAEWATAKARMDALVRRGG
jgi:hypothetical protein